MGQQAARYEIARFTGRCAATDQVLEPGQPCIAAIAEREEDAGFDRFDYTLDAWNDGVRPDRLFSYWQTTVPDPTEPKRVFVDDDLLINLFERLADDDRPRRIAFRFVIALVLMRKKRLVYVDRTQDETSQIWHMRWRGGGPEAEVFDVINPQLEDADVQSISDQLSEILNGDLD